MSTVTKADRDRAHRLGTIAAKSGRGLGGACPYDANGSAADKLLALVFVRGYVAAGGQVDGLDYGDGSRVASPAELPTTGKSPDQASRPRGYRGEHRAYGHLGLPL